MRQRIVQCAEDERPEEAAEVTDRIGEGDDAGQDAVVRRAFDQRDEGPRRAQVHNVRHHQDRDDTRRAATVGCEHACCRGDEGDERAGQRAKRAEE